MFTENIYFDFNEICNFNSNDAVFPVRKHRKGEKDEADLFLEVALQEYDVDVELNYVELRQNRSERIISYEEPVFNWGPFDNDSVSKPSTHLFSCYSKKCQAILDEMEETGYFSYRSSLLHTLNTFKSPIIEEIWSNLDRDRIASTGFCAEELFLSATFCRILEEEYEFNFKEKNERDMKVLRILDRDRRVKISESFQKEVELVLLRKRLSIVSDQLERDMKHFGNILRRQSFEKNKDTLNEKLKTVLGKKLIIFLQNVKSKTRNVKKKMNKARNRRDSQKIRKTKKKMNLKRSKKKALKAIFGVNLR